MGLNALNTFLSAPKRMQGRRAPKAVLSSAYCFISIQPAIASEVPSSNPVVVVSRVGKSLR